MTAQIRTLADVERIERRPISELELADNVYQAIRQTAGTCPDRAAIYGLLTGAADEEPSCLSYRQFLDQLHRTANLFIRLGVEPDDAVTLLLPITPDAMVCLWAAEAAGIANPVNSFVEVDHLESIVRSAAAKVVVAWHPTISASSWDKGVALKARLPDLHLIQVGGDGGDDDIGAICYEQAIAGEPSDALERPCQKGHDDIAAYLHTGGTTGLPKLARHTHPGSCCRPPA
jgi:fatty-acyl-CoA synthase